MHSYLRAIGFSDIKNRLKLNKLFEEIINNPSNINKVKVSDDLSYSEISMEYADGIGITIRGEYDSNNNFHIEHYYPYLIGHAISTREEIGINKRVETESYTGMCDDYRLGVSLIFYIQNVIEYVDKKNKNMSFNTPFDISLAALSLNGKILLPVEKSEKQKKNITAEAKYRNNLIAEAKKGNQEAIDSLTIDDIDTYAMVSRRIRNEDIYTIVDSSFIPFGSESDNYSILAIIEEYNLVVNSHTKEEIYDLKLVCNDIAFRTSINKKDLVGEPEVGRRFKGNVWLQGNIKFTE